MIRDTCSSINIVIYSFLRTRGSLVRWNWLAIIIRGKSHIVSIRRGVDRGSEKKSIDELRLLSLN